MATQWHDDKNSVEAAGTMNYSHQCCVYICLGVIFSMGLCVLVAFVGGTLYSVTAVPISIFWTGTGIGIACVVLGLGGIVGFYYCFTRRQPDIPV